MKKLRLCVMFAIVVFAGVTEAKTGIITWSWVNFRSGPSTNAGKIGTIRAGENIKIIDEYKGSRYNWYKITYNGNVGWVVQNSVKIINKTKAKYSYPKMGLNYPVNNSNNNLMINGMTSEEKEIIYRHTKKSATFAFWLSFISPPTGQFYNGDNGRGISVVLSEFTGAAFIIAGRSPNAVAVGAVIMIGAWIFSCIDAPISTHVHNKKYRYELGLNQEFSKLESITPQTMVIVEYQMSSSLQNDSALSALNNKSQTIVDDLYSIRYKVRNKH